MRLLPAVLLLCFAVPGAAQDFIGRTQGAGLGGVARTNGVAVADYDRDGDLDVYFVARASYDAADARTWNRLYANRGDGTFTPVAATPGLAGRDSSTAFSPFGYKMGAAWGDYDNVLFRNTADAGAFGYASIAHTVGLADSAAARGLAIFDYDDDGDLDLLLSNVEETPFLYENTVGRGRWLKVALEGTLSNRDAFGAVVEVRAGGTVYRRYHHGAQYLGQNILPVHVGLGDADVVEQIVVTWPSGHVDTIDAVVVDQTVRIKETVGLVSGAQPTARDAAPPVPEALRVLGSYPNPFTEATHVRFALARPGDVTLTIFNTLGQSVRVLNASFSAPGAQEIRWEARDGQGRALGAGLYFYTLTVHAEARSEAGAMLYVK